MKNKPKLKPATITCIFPENDIDYYDFISDIDGEIYDITYLDLKMPENLQEGDDRDDFSMYESGREFRLITDIFCE